MNKYRIFVEVEADTQDSAWTGFQKFLLEDVAYSEAQDMFRIESIPENNIGTCAYCGSKNCCPYNEPFHSEEGDICYDLTCRDCNCVSVEVYEPRYLRTVKGEVEDDD